MPNKTRKPVADYITFDQYQKMLKAEPSPMYRLLYRIMWTFMLRVSEVVGQSEGDVKLIKDLRIEHKSEKSKLTWTGPIPGIRWVDIDAVSPVDAGLECRHTLRVYRKMGKIKILPFHDLELYNDLQKYVKENDLDIHMKRRIFPVLRQAVFFELNKHGDTIGGQTKIHPHALRRGGAVYMRSSGKMQLEDLQVVMSHTKLSQTLDYLGKDERTALNRFAQAQVSK